MRVVFLFDGLSIGGIEKIGINYIKMLKEENFDITVINLNPNKLDFACFLPDDIKVININFPRKICPEQYAQLIKYNFIGRFIYPIISIFLLLLLKLYKTFLKILFIEIRDKYDLGISMAGHFNDLTFLSYNFINVQKKLCWLHGGLYNYALSSSGYLNLYKKINNLIVSVNDSEEEVFMYNKGLNLNIFKLYNPVYRCELDKNKVNEIKNRYGKFLLMIARFSYPHKDHYTVVDAFEKIVNNNKENINMVFIGSGKDEENVKKYVSQKEAIKQRVYFLGDIKEIANFYQAAYILVHASVAGEGLPTVIIEALSNKLPVVATDSKVGPREILKDNKYGLLTIVKDSSDLYEKINMLLQNEKLYKNYVDNSEERYNDFKPEIIKRNFMEILQKL